MDGTYFKRNNCLVLYFDHDFKYHQLWRYSTAERRYEIEQDLRALKRAGINIISATTDGRSSLKLALLEVFPEAIHQRCLVHIERFAEIYLTKNPKTWAGRELKETISLVNTIATHQERMLFEARIFDWQRRYKLFLKERTCGEDGHWWYTHRNLRKVIRHILEALPDMWHYLDNKEIPKDTNGLEGRLTDLKHKFVNHRGLKRTKREQYLGWYLNTKNAQIPTQND